MTNNQKIELAQAHKAQLVESCKHCEQLYPQQLEVLDMHDVPCTTVVINV